MQEPARRRNILKKMENNLVIALSRNESSSKLFKAAQKVRDAKLSYYKGQKEIAKYQDDDKSEKLSNNIQQHLTNLDKNIEKWESLTEDEIIQLYCDKEF